MKLSSVSPKTPQSRWLGYLLLGTAVLIISLWSWRALHSPAPLEVPSSASVEDNQAATPTPTNPATTSSATAPPSSLSAPIAVTTPAEPVPTNSFPRKYIIRGSVLPWQEGWSALASVDVFPAKAYQRSTLPSLRDSVRSDGRFQLDVSALATQLIPLRAGLAPDRMVLRLTHPTLLSMDREFQTTDFVETSDEAGKPCWEWVADLSVVPAALVKGRLVDPSGEALRGADVGVFCGARAQQPFSILSETRSATDGRFELKVPSLGDHELLVVALQHPILRSSLVVDSYRELDLGELKLRQGHTIRGSVRTRKGDYPWVTVVGCSHTVHPNNFTFMDYPRFPTVYWLQEGALALDRPYASLTEEGRFEIVGLEPIEYNVSAARLGMSGHGLAKNLVKVLAPAEGVQLQLDQPAVWMEVRSSLGPIQHARISHQRMQFVLSCLTSWRGDALIEVDVGESVEFTIEHPSYVGEKVVVQPLELGAVERKLVTLKPTAAGTLELTLNAGSAGLRIPRVSATLRNQQDGQLLLSGAPWETNVGMFRIAAIPPGHYLLELATFGDWNDFECYWMGAQTELKIVDQQTTVLRLDLAPCGRLEVVTKPSGASTNLNWLDLRDAEGRSVNSMPQRKTSVGGAAPSAQILEEVWVFGDLKAGEYELRVTQPESAPFMGRLQVELGRTTRVNSILR